jgi:hypothetical protein
MKLKRALLIGIDRYSAFQDLTGCRNDVEALAPLLSRHAGGERNFDCRALTSGDAAAQTSTLALSAAVADLLSPGADTALLYFAGHAAQLENELYLVSRDGTAGAPGVAMSQIIDWVFQSKVSEVVFVLDCCFSGQAGQVSARYAEAALLRNGLSILTSSRADQTSAEADGHGFFSVRLCQALAGAAAEPGTGRVTVASAHQYISSTCGAWDQQPALKVNLIAPCELRRCAVGDSAVVDGSSVHPGIRAAKSKPWTLAPWIAAGAALVAVAAGVAWKLGKPARQGSNYTDEVVITCDEPHCSQDVTVRCPRGTRAANKCDLRIARGSCEITEPRSVGVKTEFEARSTVSSQCLVRCLCSRD